MIEKKIEEKTTCSFHIPSGFAIYIEEIKDVSAGSLENFILLDNEGLAWKPNLPYQKKTQSFTNDRNDSVRKFVELRHSIVHDGKWLVINAKKGTRKGLLHNISYSKKLSYAENISLSNKFSSE